MQWPLPDWITVTRSIQGSLESNLETEAGAKHGSTYADCIQPVLCRLHWLPTEYQIWFEVLTLTF